MESAGCVDAGGERRKTTQQGFTLIAEGGRVRVRIERTSWVSNRIVGLLVVPLLLPLAGCALTPGDAPTPTAVAARPSSIPVTKLVGRWGVASYREEKDRQRTEAQARAQCKQPYVIAKGPTDGVMMHVADDPKLYELTLKGGINGRTYLGFDAPPGDDQDREIVSFTDNLVVMRWVSADISTRYGVFVYVRCK
jgi:hypothetical protein